LLNSANRELSKQNPALHYLTGHFSMADPRGFVFEDEDPDPVTLQNELDQLDHHIKEVRFESRSSSPAEILSQITELMEARNKLYDRVRAARIKKFRADIFSLKLPAIHVQSVFSQSSRRCTFVPQDPRLNASDETDGKTKKKKKGPKHPWADSRKAYLRHRRDDLVRELAAIKEEKVLSVSAEAQKKRAEWECAGIDRELEA
jgi:hypothetical protein